VSNLRVPCRNQLRLPARYTSARANPKSSTGRIDVWFHAPASRTGAGALMMCDGLLPGAALS